MAQIAVAEVLGDVVGPALEFGGVHLDRGAASATGQVVVVRVVHAAPVERFTSISHDDVDQVGVGELLELAVDRGEGYLTAISHDQSVKILRADEALYPFQGANDLAALVGVSSRGHGSIVVASNLLTGMIPANITRMVLEYRRHRARWLGPAVVLIVGSFALAGCGPGASTPGVIQVVGAEVQYGDVLSQIGGPYVHVTSVMSNPTTDPHNFEASPSVARAIASAQLIVQNGAGYDSFMNQLEAASAGSSRVVLAIATMRHQVTAANPHFWYSPSTMPMLARVVTNDLAKIAPSHAAYFRARDVAFQAAWRPVSLAIAAASRQFAHRPVATTEPVGDYLLSAMGLNNRTPFRFQADVMNGIDPSPEDIVTQQNLLNHHRVGVLCFNAQVSSPVTSALRNLAAQDKVPLVALYETMPAGQHVQGWILEEISALEAALGNGVSTLSFS